MKDNTLYLGHIKDAIEKIETYIADVDYDRFASNNMMVDAVLRELAVIGEATNNLSEDFRRSHHEMPFRDIIDMRNIFIHDYAGVNIKVVWDTCRNNLPELKEFVASYFQVKHSSIFAFILLPHNDISYRFCVYVTNLIS